MAESRFEEVGLGIVEEWHECLNRGEVLLLDGGTGTELERRGVPMDSAAWCGTAALDHQDAIRDLHEEYIRCGADAIITNTFATHRPMLEAAGLGNHVAAIVRGAVAAAMAARDRAGRPEVLVAGSLSTMAPGADRSDYPPRQVQSAAFREQCELLAEAGIDAIALEMMQDTESAPRAFEAAKATGLPVWLGVSARKDPDSGAITPFNWPRESFADRTADLANRIAARAPVAVRYTLDAVREGLKAPLSVGLRLERALSGIVLESEEAQKGLEDFFAKRRRAAAPD